MSQFLQTSVYSQHCAIAVCRKSIPTFKSKLVSLCALYIFPCGGSSKILTEESVPFLRSKEVEPVGEGGEEDSLKKVRHINGIKKTLSR